MLLRYSYCDTCVYFMKYHADILAEYVIDDIYMRYT
jgi:hypothetical protein